MNYPFLLKFSKITNLTEARIASGFFADYLSFDCSPNSDLYIEPHIINEIMGWVVGPKLVLSFENEPFLWINDYCLKFNPTFIELPINRINEDFSEINAEILWKTDTFDELFLSKGKFFESSNLNISKQFFERNSICFFANINYQNIDNCSIGGLTLFGEKEKEVGKSEKLNWYNVLENF